MNRVYIVSKHYLLLYSHDYISILFHFKISLQHRSEPGLPCVLQGHNNDSTDMDYLLEILSKGVWMGLDRTCEYALNGILSTVYSQRCSKRSRVGTVVREIISFRVCL